VIASLPVLLVRQTASPLFNLSALDHVFDALERRSGDLASYCSGTYQMQPSTPVAIDAITVRTKGTDSQTSKSFESQGPTMHWLLTAGTH